jgi:cell division protease FtsH
MLTVMVVISAVLLVNLLGGPGTNLTGLGTSERKLSITDFRKEVDSKNVATARWQRSTITGKLADDSRYTVRVFDAGTDAGNDLQRELRDAGVELVLEDPPMSEALVPIIGMLIGPLLIVVLLWYMFNRAAQAGGNQAMSFGRSRAKRANDTGPKITFEDVAGIEEAKAELYEIVDFLRNTKKYVALGAKIPKGILLTGPPGVGKTHLARAIAGEAGVPFFHISGSDFVEMFVGVGAARVRDLFETAKAHRPCLIFVDEIDAVGRQRGAGLGGGHDEREQTLNQLLVEMDGFDANTGVIMIAATNRPDVLDPALLRPGRFDRQIVVDAPDANGREAILKIHAKGKPLDNTVDLGVIAKRTPGFTGADLANSLNEAALLAARRNKNKVGMGEMEEALDRVMAGPQRRSRVMDEEEREVIAYHEAGHAVIGELLEHCDPVHKITILPRGMSLGSTWALPEKDTYLVSEEELMDDIAMSLGGRVAEEVVYDRIWTGSSSDLSRVTRIARAMVCEYGMSKIGALQLGRRGRNPFLGRDYHEDRDYSEEVAKQIDEEVRHLVDTAHHRAKDILLSNRDKLDRVAKALLERETLDREEFLAVMEGRELPERPVPSQQEDEEPQSVSEPSDQLPSGSTPPRLEPGPA